MSRDDQAGISFDLYHRAQQLSPEAVVALEVAVAATPDDLRARAQLIGFYFEDQSWEAQVRRIAHVHWIIRHHPEIDLGAPGSIIEELAPEGHAEARRRWLAVLAVRPDVPVYLRNASRFFQFDDAELAEELRQRGAALEPSNPWWPRAIAEARMRAARRSETDRIRLAHEALAAYEVALALTPATKHHTLLPALAAAAVEAAELTRASEAAEQVLGLVATAPGWSQGQLVHTGHVVLGRVALARDDVPGTCIHLAAAGATPGGPALNTFGPDLVLAAALLARGERAAVVAYLEACKAFWKYDHGALARWQARIARGETPMLDKHEELDDASG